ncbi:MAG: oligosaccharide flippase family protein [Tunicatimonas sp.]
MIRLLKSDYAKSFAGQITMAASNMVAFSVLARFLTKVELGNWVVILTITAFVESFRAGFFSAAYTKIADSKSHRREDIGFTVLVMNIFGQALIVALIGLCSYFLYDIRLLLFYVGTLTVSSLLFDFVQWHTLALRDFTKNTQIILTQSCINLLSIASLAIYGNLTLSLVVITTLASKLVTTLLYISAFSPFFVARSRFVPEVSRAIIRFGKHTATTMLGSQAMRLTDITLLGWMAGPAMVALLSVPDKLVQVVAIPIRSINKAFYPKAAVFHSINDHTSWRQEFSTTLTVVLLLCSVVSLVVLIFAKPLVTLLGGTEFTQAADVLRLYILVVSVNSIATLLGVSLESVGYPQANSTLLVVLVPLNLIADYVALRGFPRPEAVILVTLLTAFLGMVWFYIKIKKRTNFTISYYLSSGLKYSLNKLLVHANLK